MKIILLLLSHFALAVLCHETSNEVYYNPNEDPDRLVLWKGLFTKLNALSENILDVKERQENQGNQMAKVVENVNSNANEMAKLREAAEYNANYLKEALLESRLEDLERKISKLADSTCSSDSIMKYLNELRLESNKSQNDQAELPKELSPQWTTVLRRQDGSVDFYRNWTEYQKGFGSPPDGEFFIGLDRLHEMTTDGPHELMVVVKDWKNEMAHAHYDLFQIGGENEKYALKVLGKYTGDAGDSLVYNKDMEFSTYDRDNDKYSGNCAVTYKGAWWFKSCYYCHLNGQYRQEHQLKEKGVQWDGWKGYYSFKYAEMKIRPKNVGMP